MDEYYHGCFKMTFLFQFLFLSVILTQASSATTSSTTSETTPASTTETLHSSTMSTTSSMTSSTTLEKSSTTSSTTSTTTLSTTSTTTSTTTPKTTPEATKTTAASHYTTKASSPTTWTTTTSTELRTSPTSPSTTRTTLATSIKPPLRSQAVNLTVIPGTYSANVSFVEPENETNRLFQLVVNGENKSRACIVLFRNVTSCKGENNTKSMLQNFQCEARTTDQAKTIIHEITDLLPYSNYTVKVVMVKCERMSPIESRPAEFHFMTATAGPVRNLTIKTNGSLVCITWAAPQHYRGPVDYIYEIYDQVNNLLTRYKVSDLEMVCLEETKLFGFWEYSVNVTANNSKKSLKKDFITKTRNATTVALSSESCCEDKCPTPSPETYTTVFLKWDDPKPEQRGTRLTKYVISDGKGLKKTEPLIEFLTKASDKDYRRREGSSHCIKEEVAVGTKKSFRVDTYDENGNVVSTSTIPVSRPIRAPPKWKESEQVRLVKVESTTITVSFSDKGFFYNKAYGTITDRFLLVKKSDCRFPTQFLGQLKNHSLYWNAGGRLHLVKIPNNTDSVYTVGAGGSCDGFCNGELSPSTLYCIAGYVCTSAGCTSSPFLAATTKEGKALTVVVSLVCLTLFVIVIVVIAAMLWKYKKSDKRSLHLPLAMRPGVDLSKIPREQPIVLSQMAVRVLELHSDSNRLFSLQYEELVKVSPKHPNNAANLDDNKQKNRYVDVLPFDKSRVILKTIDNEETTDYINASFLPGYNWDKEYVACQGPLPGTVDDFWRMIWEQNVSIIVMVTSIKENGKVKCEEYWPVDVQEPKQYGNIVVENISFSALSTFNVNILKLRINDDEYKTVKQFHFLNWRDMSADIERNDIISFVRTVRSYMRPDMAGPMVVHCSAGVGRTGTFICLDYIIQFIENHDLQEQIDIYAYVLSLRDNRPRMVQTESQYIFIHDCAKQLVEEKQEALDKLSEDELMYVNTDMCPVDQEGVEEVKSLIYENAELSSTEGLVQQTEL